MDIERWMVIPSFEDYSVSSDGRVRNEITGRVLVQQRNQLGVTFVGLVRGRQQFSRSVAPLVAEAFLPEPEHHSWTTPINLNGDRSYNAKSNLLWRPLWFARKFHHQFQLAPAEVVGIIQDIDTGETGEPYDFVMSYGLLHIDIIIQAINYTDHGNRHTKVWPTDQQFRYV